MAVTKILARKGGLNGAINYILNGDKTEEQTLVAAQYCSPETAPEEMRRTKEQFHMTDGVQYYHIIQSFAPGEVTPELALEIAQAFVREHLWEYEAVIGVHTDRAHVHAHIIFNSVRWDGTGKYHSNAKTYYSQIRTISDRLCREHGLSVIMQGEQAKAMSYVEWLRQSKGQPTYRSMLEADLKTSIEDANDIGEFFMRMEHMGYELRHGNRLGFRLRGQEHFMYPERKDPQYSEDGIRAAIGGNLSAIAMGQKPAYIVRPMYRPYKKHPKYKGFLALYVHYLYILGKVKQQQYPPKMTAKLKKEVMRFEQLREQFKFLREHGITTAAEMDAFQGGLEDQLKDLTKQRTILNVQKKKQRDLYAALAHVEALAPAKQLYEDGFSGVEPEYERFLAAETLLRECGIPREKLAREKAEIYTQLADLNRAIRQKRRQLKLIGEISKETPIIQKELQSIEKPTKVEVKHYDKQR